MKQLCNYVYRPSHIYNSFFLAFCGCFSYFTFTSNFKISPCHDDKIVVSMSQPVPNVYIYCFSFNSEILTSQLRNLQSGQSIDLASLTSAEKKPKL